MNKRTRVIVISVIGLIIVLFLVLYLALMIYVNKWIEASKPKITEDISESESAFLQDQVGISLPPGAEITVFSYSHEIIIIRIEGVEDLPAFLTDSLCLGISENEAEELAERIYGYFERDTNLFTDMFGVEHRYEGLSPSDYPLCPIHSTTRIRFFLLDGKLTIEMEQWYYVSEDYHALREIAVKEE